MPNDWPRNLESRYADLLTGPDAVDIEDVRRLDAAFGEIWPPAELWNRAPHEAPGQRWKPRVPRVATRLSLRTGTGWVTVAAALLVALVLITRAMQAGPNITDLGPPRDAALQPSVLGQYVHVGPALRQHGKVEFLFISARGDADAAAERWAIVKALGWFGSFSGLNTDVSRVGGMGGPQSSIGPVPTYNFLRARYSSRYLIFVHKDLTDAILGVERLQRLSAQEAGLFRKYATLGVDIQAWGGQTSYFMIHASGSPPMELIGGYVANGSNVPAGDIGGINSDSIANEPRPSFEHIQQAVRSGASQNGDSYVHDVDAEANLIAALICRVDGGKPRRVCGRQVIREIERGIAQ